MFFVLLVPVIGGLIYGPLVDRFAREARGHGVPEVMLAVTERGARIAPQVAVVKSIASALCIGSGGSVGREGPIVQIGSALGSSLGQWLKVPDPGSGCWWPAERQEAFRSRSTRPSPGCASPWNSSSGTSRRSRSARSCWPR
jgi:hypothetical protein